MSYWCIGLSTAMCDRPWLVGLHKSRCDALECTDPTTVAFHALEWTKCSSVVKNVWRPLEVKLRNNLDKKSYNLSNCSVVVVVALVDPPTAILSLQMRCLALFQHFELLRKYISSRWILLCIVGDKVTSLWYFLVFLSFSLTIQFYVQKCCCDESLRRTSSNHAALLETRGILFSGESRGCTLIMREQTFRKGINNIQFSIAFNKPRRRSIVPSIYGE